MRFYQQYISKKKPHLIKVVVLIALMYAYCLHRPVESATKIQLLKKLNFSQGKSAGKTLNKETNKIVEYVKVF